MVLDDFDRSDLVIRAGDAFLASLSRERRFAVGADGLSTEPIVPWITPKVPPIIEAMMREVGVERRLEAGEYIFPKEEAFDSLVMLTEGLGARMFGSLLNQPGNAIALSIPGRIIGGNHCFFSERPGVGRYAMLTQGRCLAAPKRALKALARSREGAVELLAAHLDMCLQSDRLAFGTIALLPVRTRLKMWALSWALTYGSLDGEKLHLQPALPVELLAHVVSAATSQVKRDLRALRAEGRWVRNGAGFTLDASLLDEPWEWLCASEEWTALHARPQLWRPLLTPASSTAAASKGW